MQEFRPFCSRGCRDRDLINWVDEGYKMPAAPEEDERAPRPNNRSRAFHFHYQNASRAVRVPAHICRCRP